MLPPFIIEQIRRREADERQRNEAQRPRLQLPLHHPFGEGPGREADNDADGEADNERGVVIIDL